MAGATIAVRRTCADALEAALRDAADAIDQSPKRPQDGELADAQRENRLFREAISDDPVTQAWPVDQLCALVSAYRQDSEYLDAADDGALEKRCKRQDARLQALTEALSTLVDRLEFVHADPHYQSVWTIAHVHGFVYSGPKYDTELNAAKAVLAGSSRSETGQASTGSSS